MVPPFGVPEAARLRGNDEQEQKRGRSQGNCNDAVRPYGDAVPPYGGAVRSSTPTPDSLRPASSRNTSRWNKHIRTTS